MNRLIFIFVFCFSLASSFAQVPVAGYFGKRAAISYHTYFMFGPKGSGPYMSAPKGYLSPTINNAQCLNLDYVFNYKRAACLSVQYVRTGLAYDDGKRSGFGSIFTTASDTPYPVGHKYTGSFNKPALLQAINFSLGLKTFRSGFVPPVGRYRKIEVLLLYEMVDYNHKDFAVQDPYSSAYPPTYIQSNFGSGSYSYINFAVAYSFGKQRVISDKILIDYGIRFGVTPQFNIISIAASDEYVRSAESYYKHEANMRMLRQQAINLHFGIGFLAF